MDYNKLKRQIDNYTKEEQWEWIIKNKKEITLDLGNDNTTFTFDKEDKTGDCALVDIKADIGNRLGIEILLKILGIKANRV